MTSDTDSRERAGFRTLAALTGAASALLLFMGSWPIRGTSWDVFILLDGAWRILHGQVPHLDYPSPVGLIPQWIVAFAMQIFGPSSSALGQGPALVIPLIFAIAWWIGRQRLPTGRALVFTAMATFLWVGPFPHGDIPWRTSYAMYYNRIGWSFFMLLALECCFPRLEAGTRRLARVADGVVAGILAALLFLTKFNYFAAGAALVAFSFFSQAARGDRLAGLLGGSGLVLLAVRLATGLDPLTQLADVDQLGLCLHAADYLRGIVWMWADLESLWLFMAIWLTLAGFAWRRGSPPDRPSPLAVLSPALVLTALGSVVMLANMTRTAIPLLGLIYLFLEESLRRARWEEDRAWARTGRRLVTFLTATTCGFTILCDYGFFLSASWWKIVRAPGLPAFHRIHTSTLDDLLFLSDPPENVLDRAACRLLYDRTWMPAVDAVASIQPANDGLLLLLEKTTGKGRLAILDFVNPFSIALGFEPARGSYLFCHLGRTLCPDNLRPPEAALGEADWVVVARGSCLNDTGLFLQQSYKDHLEKNYEERGSTRYWAVFGRKPPR